MFNNQPNVGFNFRRIVDGGALGSITEQEWGEPEFEQDDVYSKGFATNGLLRPRTRSSHKTVHRSNASGSQLREVPTAQEIREPDKSPKLG